MFNLAQYQQWRVGAVTSSYNMEAFFTAIENHGWAAFFTALFIIIVVGLLAAIFENIKSK